MLLKKVVLDSIERGEVDRAFRRWVKPTVKSGGTLRTANGLLEILAVEPVVLEDISAGEAERAGTDLEDLMALLDRVDDGVVYRIRFGGFAPDPRVELAHNHQLSESDVAETSDRLKRLDRVSKRGPWTREFLELIRDNPRVRAEDLADRMGLEKAVFKNDVRKLKAMGLTLSFSPGYELSPRGAELLRRLSG